MDFSTSFSIFFLCLSLGIELAQTFKVEFFTKRNNNRERTEETGSFYKEITVNGAYIKYKWYVSLLEVFLLLSYYYFF